MFRVEKVVILINHGRELILKYYCYTEVLLLHWSIIVKPAATEVNVCENVIPYVLLPVVPTLGKDVLAPLQVAGFSQQALIIPQNGSQCSQSR
jgi:hypothetical protein